MDIWISYYQILNISLKSYSERGIKLSENGGKREKGGQKGINNECQ